MTLSRSIPALPVHNVVAAAAFYTERLGFAILHKDDAGFAIVARDEIEIHLWQADDERWRTRGGADAHPVRSGAESFIAGTASCRIETDSVDDLYSEMKSADVLHPTDRGAAADTEWGTREFATLDLDGNLITFFQTLDPSRRAR